MSPITVSSSITPSPPGSLIETAKRLYLVMEYAPRGDLLDYINARIAYFQYMRKEGGQPTYPVYTGVHVAAARYIAAQLMVFLQFSSRTARGRLMTEPIGPYITWDLKLENILVTSKGGIKVSDFGYARFYEPAMNLTEPVKEISILTLPPESLRHRLGLVSLDEAPERVRGFM